MANEEMTEPTSH